MLTDYQSWVNGAANNGIIIADSVTGDGADFDSSESATAISRPRLEVTYTVPVSPPNQPPTAAFNHSCTELDCDFTDTSSDSDGSVTGWSWDFGDGNNSIAQNPSHSYAADGTYTVELTATDNEGATDVTSTQVSVSTTPSFTDVVANADLFGSGTVSGTYADTQTDNGNAQSIYERESGGKKQNRYSFLVHTWQFNLPVNAMATVYANAWSGGSGDDDFRFSWSTDNNSYTEMFTVASTDATNTESFLLPANTSGTLYVRVEDTDQTPGNRTRDTVFVDHLYIRAESGAGDPPAAPSSLVATTFGADRIDLVWNDNADDEAGFRVERSLDGSNFAEVGTTNTNDTSFSDTGLDASTTYWYRVNAFNVSGPSGYSNTDSATTDLGPSISLSLNGYKTKGRHIVELDWGGTTGSDVDIYRDGGRYRRYRRRRRRPAGRKATR